MDPCALRSMVSVRTWALRVSISCRAVWSFPFTASFVGPPEPSGRPLVLGASSGIEGEVDGLVEPWGDFVNWSLVLAGGGEGERGFFFRFALGEGGVEEEGEDSDEETEWGTWAEEEERSGVEEGER